MHAPHRYLPILAAVLVSLALAGLVALVRYYVDAKERLEATADVRNALGEAREEIDRRLETALAVPETLAAVIAAEEHIDAPTFEAIAARLVRANPSIRNVALAPGNVITAVYPVHGNEAVLGLRYAQVPAQYGAVQRAMRSRRTVIAGPIPLVQGGKGLVARTPVFLRDSSGGDNRYWGIVSLAVNVDQLFVDIARIAEHRGLAIAVRQADPDAVPGPALSGDPRVFASTPVSMRYPLPGGGRWELAAVPRDGWASVQGMPMWLLVVLYASALLAGWYTYRMLASHDRDRLLAGHDALTGLLNRKSFDHDLNEAMQQREPRSCALVLIDLDRFKPVNDTHGHSAGDLVLQQIAERLQQVTQGDDAAYRLGGDEFALLLQGRRGTRELFHQVDRAVQLIRQPVVLASRKSVSVDASTGVAVFPSNEEPEHATAVFDRADRALYRCKQDGRRSHAAAASEV
jgi:diguanylate cyclase (GGDEF)-like protein